jgi:putative heme-binding domain-containing protein
MLANALTTEETWKVIAYLRSLGTGVPVHDLGDRAAGERIFFKAGCSKCHMVSGRGGRLGPDLTRVGSSRSVRYLAQVIRDPNNRGGEEHVEGDPAFGPPTVCKTVLVTTRDGRRIIGVPRNEDSFSLQLMDQQEQLRMFLKEDLSQIVHERKSLMPSNTEEVLSEDELRNLLAYMEGLNGK